jgi:N-acetylmuramoyl-L-alanine amidase
MTRAVIAATACALALAPAGAAPAGPRPVVWVQAGHEGPREPGYRAQTGAAGEVDFTVRVAAAVERRLRAAGIDARHTPSRVTPNGAAGAVLISIHHDTPQGHAAVGHAITGAGENWYHGEGTGAASSTPYPDSAPHRAATTVSATVEARSLRLARLLANGYRSVFTRANGARSGSVRLEPRSGNRRMMRYFGYYRTRADARVLIEAGAGGTDGAILRRTDLVAGAIAGAIVAHLRAEGTLSR